MRRQQINLTQLDEKLEGLRQLVAEDFDKAVAWAKNVVTELRKSFGGMFAKQDDDYRLLFTARYIAKALYQEADDLTAPEERVAIDLVAQKFGLAPKDLNDAIQLQLRKRPKSAEKDLSPGEYAQALMLRMHATKKGLHPGAYMDRLQRDDAPKPPKPGYVVTPKDSKFQVGEKVIVIDRTSNYHGMEGAVTEIAGPVPARNWNAVQVELRRAAELKPFERGFKEDQLDYAPGYGPAKIDETNDVRHLKHRD